MLRRNVFHHHGTSICLAYIPACILSHIGPLWEFNSAIIMMVVSPTPPHYPLQAVIIIVTSGARFGPVGPQTFTARTSPGRTWLQAVVFIVMRSCTAGCDICSCIISTPRDRFSPLACACATTDSRVRLEQTGSRTAEVLTVHFSMSLLAKSSRRGQRSDPGGECPVITLQYPRGQGA